MEEKSPLLSPNESDISSQLQTYLPSENERICLNNSQGYQIPEDNTAGNDIRCGYHASDGTGLRTRRVCFSKAVAFCISCLAKFVTGAVFVFFVYQDAIKHQFNYSQKEVEVLASMMNIGLGLGFLPGIFFDKFGPRMTSAVGLIICTGSYLLIWSSTYTVEFFRGNSWLMSIFFLFTGFGPGFTLMVALNTNIMNFHKRHTGKVVGTLNAFFAGSPSVFATIYYNLFASGDKSDPEKQEFRGFMLLIAIMFCVINVLNLLFVYKIPSSHPEISVVVDNEANGIRTTSEDSPLLQCPGHGEIHGEMEDDSHISFCNIVRNAKFVLFLIIFSFASTASLVFGVNITVISKSMKLESYNSYLTIISPTTNAVFSIGIGFFSDYFKHRIPRLQIIIAGCAAFGLCYLLVVVSPQSIVALMIAAFLCGIGIAFLYSVTPALLKEMFSMRDFGRNWGIYLLAQSAVSMPSQILFGAMYDAQAKPGEGHDCTGSRCIVGGMAVFLGMSVAAVMLGFVMTSINRIKRLCCRSPLH